MDHWALGGQWPNAGHAHVFNLNRACGRDQEQYILVMLHFHYSCPMPWTLTWTLFSGVSSANRQLDNILPSWTLLGPIRPTVTVSINGGLCSLTPSDKLWLMIIDMLTLRGGTP